MFLCVIFSLFIGFLQCQQNFTLVHNEFTNTTFPDSDYGWSFSRVTLINSPYTTTCGNVSLFGGYNKFGLSLSLQKSIDLIFPHYQVQLTMKFYKIDAWDLYIDGFIIYNYNSLLTTLNFAPTDDSNTFLCGNAHVDAVRFVNITFAHNTQIFDLYFQDTLSLPTTTKSYGFRDLLIYVMKCDPTCYQCTGSLATQCVSCYPFAGWHSNNNSCLCNQGFFSSYNLDQSNLCNVMPCTTCQLCNETCQTCSDFGSNNCTSCFSPDKFVNNSCISPLSNMIISREFFGNGITNQDISNWVVSSNLTSLTSQCGALSLFGGYNIFGKGVSITKIYQNLPPHWTIHLSFLFMKIDSWSDSSVYVYFDGNLTLKQKPFLDYYSLSSSCGTSDIDNEMLFSVNSTHKSGNLTLNITTDLDGDASQKSWGITRLVLKLDKCYIMCFTCFNSGRYNCLTCYPGAKLLATNECICNTGLFFYINMCLNPCPNLFYGDSIDGFCKSCNPVCQNCFGPNISQCLSCPIGSFLYNNTCLQFCPNTTFSDINSRVCLSSCSLINKYNNYTDRTCGTCDISCLNCVGPFKNQCLSCNNSLGLTFYNSYCLQNCSNNQFLYLNGTQTTCLSTCPDGYYAGVNSSLGLCQPCNAKCKTCFGSMDYQCFGCVNPFYFYTDNFACLNTCPLNTYYQNMTCLKCDSNCLQCIQNLTNQCFQCASNYYKLIRNNQIVCDFCNESSVYINQSSFCLNCSNNCQTCINDTTCTICKKGYFLNSNNICVDTCPKTYYADNNSAKCMNCDSSCGSCYGSSSNQCNECINPYFQNGNSCVSQCPLNMTNVNYICQNCLANCLICHQNFSYVCDKCNSGFYLFNNNNSMICSPCNMNSTFIVNNTFCVICDSNCDICQTSQTCNLCSQNFFFNPLTSVCSPQCPIGFYPDNLSRSCKKCDYKCSLCYGGIDQQCTMCNSLYYQYFNSCNINCPLNTVDNSYNICVPCFPNCKICHQNGTLDCDLCELNFYKYVDINNQKICVSCNNSGQIISNDSCVNCGTGCKNCLSTTQCIDCLSNYYYFPLKNTCLLTCPDGFYKNASFCSSCDISCLTCFGSQSDQCFTCASNFFLFGSNCLSICPSNTTSTLNGTCKECTSNCNVCHQNYSNLCDLCNDNFYLIKNQTGTFCSRCLDNGTYVDGIYCNLCDIKCELCNTFNSCTFCKQNFFLDPLNKNCNNSCPRGYYIETITRTCQPCDLKCYDCFGQNSNQCFSCNNGYFQLNNTCLISCPQNTTNNLNNQCISCSTNCQICHQNGSYSCDQCVVNYYLYQDVLMNLTTCVSCNNSGNYILNESYCVSCGIYCNNCLSSNQCTDCIENYFYIDALKNCSSSCPNGYYTDLNNQLCLPCNTNCISCFGPNASQCYSCNNKSYQYNNTCVNQCPTSTILSNNSCIPCLENCSICNNQTLKCDQCNNGLYLFQNGTNSCSSCLEPGNFIVNNTWCIICVKNCDFCLTISECLKCQSNYYISEDTHICYDICPEGYYTDYINYKCKLCNKKCLNCFNGTDSQCFQCIQPYNFYNYSCLVQCPLNTTYQNFNCTYCSENCDVCDQSYQNKCQQCQPNYYLLSTSQNITMCTKCNETNNFIINNTVCITCSPNCLTCLSLTECEICENNYFLTKITNQCVSKCDSGYYENKINFTCEKCNSSCLECFGPTVNECISCNNSYYYMNSCMTFCPNNTFIQTGSYFCQNCPENCSACNSSQCLSCQQNFSLFLNKDFSLSCKFCNETGDYFIESNSTCINCVDNCNVCLSYNECQTCRENYYLMPNLQMCVLSCPPNYFKENGKCLPCDSSCYICYNKTNFDCIQCANNYYLYLNQCLSQCPLNTTILSSGICDTCTNNCQVCNQTHLNVCNICEANYYLDQNRQCIQCDGTGQIIIGQNCFTCDQHCNKCLSENECSQCLNGFQKNLTSLKCESICLPNEYFSTVNHICQTCNPNCYECYNGSENNCLSCSNSKYLYGASCFNQCPNSFYPNSTNFKCQECSENCEICDSANNCSSCKKTYILVQNESNFLNYCDSCKISNCDICKSANICENCSLGYSPFILQNTSICLQNILYFIEFGNETNLYFISINVINEEFFIKTRNSSFSIEIPQYIENQDYSYNISQENSSTFKLQFIFHKDIQDNQEANLLLKLNYTAKTFTLLYRSLKFWLNQYSVDSRKIMINADIYTLSNAQYLKIQFSNYNLDLFENLMNLISFKYITHPNSINNYSFTIESNNTVLVYFIYRDSIVGNTTLLVEFILPDFLINNNNDTYFNLTRYFVNMPDFYLISSEEANIVQFFLILGEWIEVVSEIIVYLINFIELGESYGMRSKIFCEFFLLIKYIDIEFPYNLKEFLNIKKNNFFLFDTLVDLHSQNRNIIDSYSELKNFSASQYFLENCGDLLIRTLIIILICKLASKIIPILEKKSTHLKWITNLRYLYYTFIWNILILQVLIYFKSLSYFSLENLIYPEYQTSYGKVNIVFSIFACLFTISCLIYIKNIFRNFKSNQITSLMINNNTNDNHEKKYTPKNSEKQAKTLTNLGSTPKGKAQNNFMIQNLFSTPEKKKSSINLQTPNNRVLTTQDNIDNKINQFSPSSDQIIPSQTLMRAATLDSTPHPNQNQGQIEWKKIPSLQKQDSLEGANSSQRPFLGKSDDLPIILENEQSNAILNDDNVFNHTNPKNNTPFNQQIINLFMINSQPDKKGTTSIEGTPAKRDEEKMLKESDPQTFNRYKRSNNKQKSNKKNATKSKSPEKYKTSPKLESPKKTSPKTFKKKINLEEKSKNYEELKMRINSPTKSTQKKLKHMIVLYNFKFSQKNVKFYMFFELLRQVIIGFTLIGLINWVFIQIIIINSINLFMIIFFLKTWPFKSFFDNILQLFYEILMNITCVSLLILIILVNNENQNSELRISLGWTIISSNLLFHFLMIGIFCWNLLKLLKFGFIKVKFSKKNKIHSEISNENKGEHNDIEPEKKIINLEKVPVEHIIERKNSVDAPLGDFMKTLKKTRNLMKGIVDDA